MNSCVLITSILTEEHVRKIEKVPLVSEHTARLVSVAFFLMSLMIAFSFFLAWILVDSRSAHCALVTSR